MKINSSAAIVFLFSAMTYSQDIAGNIEGRIRDSSGIPLFGVNISVQSENLQGIKGTATNEKGYFSILFLPVGNYKVDISMLGTES